MDSTPLFLQVELQRPIICICNDKYAPVLRDLRPLALELELAPPKYDLTVSSSSSFSLSCREQCCLYDNAERRAWCGASRTSRRPSTSTPTTTRLPSCIANRHFVLDVSDVVVLLVVNRVTATFAYVYLE